MLGRLRGDRGAFNLVSTIVYLVLAGVAYYCWVYAVPFLNYMDVRKGVRVACNAAYLGRSEDNVRDVFLKQWKEIGMQDHTLGDNGEVEVSPTPIDRDDNMDVDLEKTPPQVTLTVHYTQTIVLPLIKKQRETHWTYTHTEELKDITW